MNLEETFQLLAIQVPVDPEQLVQFAAEDSIGGWDLDKGGWPTGSLWSVEGKVLYALIRALQPELVVEIGTHRGCSTTHIATALSINGKGLIASIDTAEGVGDLIPPQLMEHINLIADNGVDWLIDAPDESVDIIYEDADHSTKTSRDVAALAMRVLKPGGLLITHDAAHDYAWLGDGSQIPSPVGETIRRGLADALGEQYRVYRTDPSDCGFALWQKPGFTKDVVPTVPNASNFTTDVHSEPVNPALAQAIAQMKAGDPAAQQPLDDAHTYEEARIESETAANEQAEAAQAKPLEEWTKAELEAYAEKASISLSGSRTNADRVAKIRQAQAAKE